MSTPLTIPKLSMSMTEGVLTEWLVADGDQVSEGTAIYSIETGKTVEEVSAPASGKLIQKAQAGETYAVGTPIGEIL